MDPTALASLVSMGAEVGAAKTALRATGGNVDAAAVATATAYLFKVPEGRCAGSPPAGFAAQCRAHAFPSYESQYEAV